MAALLAFVAAGHTLTRRVFRLHVARLVEFLNRVVPASDTEKRLAGLALGAAASGNASPGDWCSLADDPVPGGARSRGP